MRVAIRRAMELLFGYESKREDLRLRKTVGRFLLSLRDAVPMMYCRPYLYVRCTWPGLSCTHVRMHITHGCGVPVGMIEGREKGGSRRTGIFRPVDLPSLFSGLYVIGSRTLLILFGALLGCNGCF